MTRVDDATMRVMSAMSLRALAEKSGHGAFDPFGFAIDREGASAYSLSPALPDGVRPPVDVAVDFLVNLYREWAREGSLVVAGICVDTMPDDPVAAGYDGAFVSFVDHAEAGPFAAVVPYGWKGKWIFRHVVAQKPGRLEGPKFIFGDEPWRRVMLPGSD